jgi:hypothetical protein
MMEAARTSEKLVNFYQTMRLHGATTQKTAIFVLKAVRTSNPTMGEIFNHIKSNIMTVQPKKEKKIMVG